MSPKTLKFPETIDTFTPKLPEHALAKWHEAKERGYLVSPNGNSELARIWARYCLAKHEPYVVIMGQGVHVQYTDANGIAGMSTDTPEPRLTPEAQARLANVATPLLRPGGTLGQHFAGAFHLKNGHGVAAFALALLRDPASWTMEPRYLNALTNGNAAQLAESYRVYGMPVPEELRQRMEGREP